MTVTTIMTGCHFQEGQRTKILIKERTPGTRSACEWAVGFSHGFQGSRVPMQHSYGLLLIRYCQQFDYFRVHVYVETLNKK